LSYLDAYGVTLHFAKSPIQTLSPAEISAWSQKAPYPTSEDQIKEALKGIKPVDDDLNDEDLVKFYATPYYDDLKADKEAAKKPKTEPDLT